MSLRYCLIGLLAGTAAVATAQTLGPQVTLQQRPPTNLTAQALRQDCSQFGAQTPLVLPRSSGLTVDPRITEALRAGGVPTGSGPLLDVFNHSPGSRAPRGSELVLNGRDFPLGKVAARIGSTQLEPLGNSSSEARFQIPASVSLENQPLVVWQEGGTPRTLVERYSVFDPTVRIHGAVPASFAKGERVLLCGRGLNNLWQATPSANNETSRMLRIGDNYIAISNVEVGAGGAELRFTAGGPAILERRLRLSGDRYEEYYYAPTETPPTRVTGRIGLSSRSLQLSSAERHQTDVYSPGEVRWNSIAPLRIDEVHSQSGVARAPFMLLTPSQPISNQLVINGTGLDVATFTLGTRTLGRGGPLSLGTQAVFAVPLDASSGELCAQAADVRRCFPTVIRVSRAPELVQVPAVIPIDSEVTLLGIGLTPDPAIQGLSYRPSLMVPYPCDTAMEVLEHSNARLRIRLRYTGRAEERARCASAPKMAELKLFGTYAGVETQMIYRTVPVSFAP